MCSCSRSDELFENLKTKNPDIVALSYRLTAKPLESILEELKSRIENGAMVAYYTKNNRVIAKKERIDKVLDEYGIDSNETHQVV